MDDPNDLVARRTVQDRLSAGLTGELLQRLAGYCALKVSRRPWYGVWSDLGASMVGGHRPEDIVQIVILKTIQGIQEGPGRGRRVWDGRRDLFDYFTSQIDSEISNLGRSWANRKVRRSTQTAERFGIGEQAFQDSVMGGEEYSPETTALCVEEEQLADEFVGGFLDSLGDDEELLVAVVGEILDGARKPSEVAEALRLPVQEVYNARKRLKRKLEDYCGRVETGVN